MIIGTASWLIIGFSILWIVAFIIISSYRYQEEKLRKEWSRKQEEINKQPISMFSITGQSRNLSQEYKPKIDVIERKRQFIRDIIPFLRK